MCMRKLRNDNGKLWNISKWTMVKCCYPQIVRNYTKLVLSVRLTVSKDYIKSKEKLKKFLITKLCLELENKWNKKLETKYNSKM